MTTATPTLTKALARYAHARRAGNLLMIAGQGSRDPETGAYAGINRNERGEITGHDIAAQAHGVLTNIERVLKANGLDRKNIVDVTVFLTDMTEFPAMNQVWNEFFQDCEPPTRTTVCVTKLPGDNYVEMKAIAALPETR